MKGSLGASSDGVAQGFDKDVEHVDLLVKNEGDSSEFLYQKNK